MLKALDKTMVIGDICVMEKRGGRSGEYRRVARVQRVQRVR
jgi:molybdenum cofactor biosynthesis enzyme